MTNSAGWIGVDLDGTLAEYSSVPADQWDPFKIGKPIPAMMERVKRRLESGHEVRIVTARAALNEHEMDLREAHRHAQQCVTAVQAWLESQGLPRLRVQAHKDYDMLELWDDRAVQVEANTGRTIPEVLGYRTLGRLSRDGEGFAIVTKDGRHA